MEFAAVLRYATGIFFVLHSVVFAIWGPTYWRIYTLEGMPYSTSVLFRRVDVGDVGIRIVGLLWLLSGAGWILAGVGLMFLATWWLGLTITTALISSIACILATPEAKYGLLINLGILVLLFLDGHYAWL